MSGPFLGRFELTNLCTHDDCDNEAEDILVLFEPKTEQMTVCCLCRAHTIYHESLFEDREKN